MVSIDTNTKNGPLDRWFWGIILVALAARLTRFPFDLIDDEAFNWFVSRDGVATAIERIHGDFFPPLYNIMLALWLKIFPMSDNIIRVPGVILGLLVVFTVYKLVAGALGTAHGRAAAALVAFSPLLAYWSQLARAFTMDGPLVIFALYFGYRILVAVEKNLYAQAPNIKAKDPTAQKLPLALFAGFIFFFAAALYTNHGLVPFVFFSFFVLAFLLVRITGQWISKPLLALAGAYALILVLWLPEVPFILAQRASSVSNVINEHNPDDERMLELVMWLFGGWNIWSLRWPNIILLFVAAAYGYVQVRRRNRLFADMVMGLGFGYLVFMLALYAVDSVFGRALQRSMWLCIPFLIFASAAFVGPWVTGASGSKDRRPAWLPALTLRTMPVLAAGLLFVLIQAQVFRNTADLSWNSSWEPIKSFVMPNVQDSDVVTTIRWMQHAEVRYAMPGVFREEQYKVPAELNRWDISNVPGRVADLSERYCSTGARRVWLFVGFIPNVAKLMQMDIEHLGLAQNANGRFAVILLPLSCSTH